MGPCETLSSSCLRKFTSAYQYPCGIDVSASLFLICCTAVASAEFTVPQLTPKTRNDISHETRCQQSYDLAVSMTLEIGFSMLGDHFIVFGGSLLEISKC